MLRMWERGQSWLGRPKLYQSLGSLNSRVLEAPVHILRTSKSFLKREVYVHTRYGRLTREAGVALSHWRVIEKTL